MSSPYLDLLLGGPLPPGEVTLLFDPSPELSLLVESPSILSIFSSFRARLAFSEGAPVLKKIISLSYLPFHITFHLISIGNCLLWLLMPNFLLFFYTCMTSEWKGIFYLTPCTHPKKTKLFIAHVDRYTNYKLGLRLTIKALGLRVFWCVVMAPLKNSIIKVLETLQKVWQKFNGFFSENTINHL